LKIWESFDWLNRLNSQPLWESLYIDVKWLSQHLPYLRFSRRFVLVRVGSSAVRRPTLTIGFSLERKITWRKSEVGQMLGQPLHIYVQTFPCVNESFWLAKYFHPFKFKLR
jgi:hypothetical protein